LTVRRASAGAIRVALGSEHLGMSSVICRHDGLVLVAMARVVEALRGTPLFGM
jgi:hypothetical protein